MGIIFDSRDSLIRSGPVSSIRDFGALRDWRGHESPAVLIDRPEDFTWSGSDHDASALNPGPYADLDNAIHYVSGTDQLIATPDVVVNGTDEEVQFGCWFKLDELPAVLTETEIPFLRLTNTSSSAYLEGVFVLQSDGSVTMRARYFTGVVSGTYTHPDTVDIVDWTFIAFHFHHVVGGSESRIWIDPGNDNQLGGGGTTNLPAGTYNQLELFRGVGVGPGNLRGIKFTDLMVMRKNVGDSTPTDVTFSTPGSGASWTVPAGITSIIASMWGGGGGSGGYGEFGVSSGPGGHGGGAGFSQASHAVTPGETLEVWVGGGGGLGLGADHNTYGVSGNGGGGGATSSLWRGASPGGTPLQVAGGAGGGGGGDNSSTTPGGIGGVGGGTTAGSGTNSAYSGGGLGGSQAAGGAGGLRSDGGPPPNGGRPGQAGTSFQGGAGADGHPTATSYGGAANGGSVNGGVGGHESGPTSLGYAGGGGGGAGFLGGGGGACSVAYDAGGGGGGGGSNYFGVGATSITNQLGSLKVPGGTADPLYVFPVGYGANAPTFSGDSGYNGADGRTIISYGGGIGTTWRQRIRDYTTQAQFDSGAVDDAVPVRLYRCSEYDRGGGQGDRFVHSIAGFLNPALALGGALNRNSGSGPLDVSNSYVYSNTCTGTTDIHYAPVSTWDLTLFCFFAQPNPVVIDGDWFLRFENDAGEYVQLERDGSDVRMRAFFSDLTTYVETLSANPLLNGAWHRLVFKSTSTTSGWLVGVNGVNYLPAQPTAVPSLSAPMTRFRFGNIDTRLALMGWANYDDPEILTTFTSQTTESAVRTYVQTRTDSVPGGTEFYCGYLPQQDTEIGISS